MREALRAWFRGRGYRIRVVDGHFDGRLHSRQLDIARDLDPSAELLTLLHEAAHVLMGHRDQDRRRAFNPFTLANQEASVEQAALRAARLLGRDCPNAPQSSRLNPRVDLDPRVDDVAKMLVEIVTLYDGDGTHAP